MGIFKFKRFSVCDDNATMKVGTDGVLLGAWTTIEGVKNILDIGTGSGIIALMLAQRTPPDTKIDAVELLKDDAQQASENVSSSPWPDKISVINSSIQKFEATKKYDLIVCNPPFFSESLLSPVKNRSSVRHDIQLTSDDLISAAIQLLSPGGQLSVILPPVESQVFIAKANARKIFLHRLTKFFSRSTKPHERSLMEFGFGALPLIVDSLTLYKSDNQWTEEYRTLTIDFYLDKQA